MHMYDKALAQHQQLSRIHEENVAWEVYVKALLKRFYSTYEDPMSDLKNIRPKGPMSVRMLRPQTLADAYCLSKLQEANNNVSKKFTMSLLPTPRYNQPYNGTFIKNQVPQVSNVNQNFNKNKPVYNNAPQRKRLTQKELDDNRAKNQCFYYKQRYVPGHKCSGRLFSLEIVEDSRDCEDETKVQCNEGVFGYVDKEVKMERGEQNNYNNESDMAAQPQISLLQSQG
nr:hypothetical protein [Tanacetum cinerariifolium]